MHFISDVAQTVPRLGLSGGKKAPASLSSQMISACLCKIYQKAEVSYKKLE